MCDFHFAEALCRELGDGLIHEGVVARTEQDEVLVAIEHRLVQWLSAPGSACDGTDDVALLAQHRVRVTRTPRQANEWATTFGAVAAGLSPEHLAIVG